jgi:hypothetical protein
VVDDEVFQGVAPWFLDVPGERNFRSGARRKTERRSSST